MSFFIYEYDRVVVREYFIEVIIYVLELVRYDIIFKIYIVIIKL